MKPGDTQVVCVAENGRGKYTATLQEVPDEPIADASEDALYEQRLANALAKSRDDFENGRYYTSSESLMATVRAKRETHAWAGAGRESWLLARTLLSQNARRARRIRPSQVSPKPSTAIDCILSRASTLSLQESRCFTPLKRSRHNGSA